jgi:hypothetical protein
VPAKNLANGWTKRSRATLAALCDDRGMTIALPLGIASAAVRQFSVKYFGLPESHPYLSAALTDAAPAAPASNLFERTLCSALRGLLA